MPFIPVLLATDVLLWLLMAAVAGYAWSCSRRPHLALPWQRVFRSRAAVACSVVLAFFVIIGFLDSLHFRVRLDKLGAGAEAGATAYSPEVQSVLDLALADLRKRNE